MFDKAIDHLNLNVPNLQQSVAFFKEKMGFTETERYNSGDRVFVFMSDGTITYELVENKELTTAVFDHIAYVSEDINKDYEYFKSTDSSCLLGEVNYVDFLFDDGVYYFFIKGAGGERIEYCQRK